MAVPHALRGSRYFDGHGPAEAGPGMFGRHVVSLDFINVAFVPTLRAQGRFIALSSLEVRQSYASEIFFLTRRPWIKLITL